MHAQLPQNSRLSHRGSFMCYVAIVTSLLFSRLVVRCYPSDDLHQRPLVARGSAVPVLALSRGACKLSHLPQGISGSNSRAPLERANSTLSTGGRVRPRLERANSRVPPLPVRAAEVGRCERVRAGVPASMRARVCVRLSLSLCLWVFLSLVLCGRACVRTRVHGHVRVCGYVRPRVPTHAGLQLSRRAGGSASEWAGKCACSRLCVGVWVRWCPGARVPE